MRRYTYKDKNGCYELKKDYVDELGIDINGLGDITDYIGELEDLEEQIGCPLEVVWWLMQDKPILVLNPIDKTLQEIEHPLNFYNPTYQTFDITCDFFETTYKKRIWTIGGVVLLLKDYKKKFWLREDKSE